MDENEHPFNPALADQPDEPAPEADPAPPPAVDPHVSLTAELVAMFEHAVEVVPALRALEPRLAAVRDRLHGILHPQKNDE